ncbi:MAG TPA: PQQ-dependent sugar dehydrogenase [Pirellulales bacterium]|nr:PQQ-dependent sugar dehydrogenase [Pirellulales bacterium]
MRLGGMCVLGFGALVGVGLCAAEAWAGTAEKAAKRPAWTTSRIQGAPQPPAPYRLVPAYPALRFRKPTCIELVPGAKRLLVTEMAGKVFSFPLEAQVKEADLIVDLQALLPGDLAGRNVSLFDAEFHPQYGDNRYLFVCYVHPGEGGHTRVSRFTLDGNAPPRAVPNSEQVIITWPSGGHNGGCLEFGKDGCLYISTGDGAGPNPPDGRTTGQDVSDLLGAILRIDVDHPAAGQAYAIPAGNPFVELKGARGEIWAYGLRNPWKFGIDVETGETFAADNGWESWEMVHRIVRGGNCGWPVMEGRAALRTEVKPGPTPILPPAIDHPHTEANSVIGGPVYRGAKLPGLAGSFIYGDYITGTIWALHADEDQSYSQTTLVDTDQRIVSFTEGAAGELYVLDYDFTGQIYELLPSDVPDTSASFPRRLSETGLFASLHTMAPAPGVVPYAVKVSRWLDGAKAERFAGIPGAGAIELAKSKDKRAVYPEGTVFAKHLTLPQTAGEPIRLETQILHYERGTWRPYSYFWDEAGQEAYLAESIGANRTLRVADPAAKGGVAERTWHVNAVNECRLCHNAESGFVLGFVANQLDRPALGGDSHAANQLVGLAERGVLASAPAVAKDDPLRLVDPHDPGQPLGDRARSYLHVNCSVCHQPGGNAIVSFYLRRDLPFDKLNTNKGTGIGTFGLSDAKIVVPGDPYRSILMYRMSKLGYARMPYIGSRVVDRRGVALVDEWIRSLEGPASGSGSAPITEGSVEAEALHSLVGGTRGGQPHESEIRTLLKTTSGALALAVRMHAGTLLGDDFKTAASLGAASATSDVRGLFEAFVPESQRRPTLGPNFDPEMILSRRGDLHRGKLIYFSDGARCRACHEIDDKSKSLGPTLAEINKKYPQPAELLSHVLRPSQKIDEPYAAYALATGDGQLLTGLIVEKNDREIVLKTAEKQIVRIAHEDVDELHKSDKSLMPDGVLSDLTAQEAADLFEYLRSLGR